MENKEHYINDIEVECTKDFKITFDAYTEEEYDKACTILDKIADFWRENGDLSGNELYDIYAGIMRSDYKLLVEFEQGFIITKEERELLQNLENFYIEMK